MALRGSEVWSYGLSDGLWVRLATRGDGFPGWDFTTAVLDTAADEMLVFGGSSGSHYSNELWRLRLSTMQWSRVVTDGGDAPGPREHSSMVLDPNERRLIVFGGFGPVVDGANPAAWGDTWVLPLEGSRRWQRVDASGPAARSGHRLVLDEYGRRAVLIGGSAARVELWSCGGIDSCDVWFLELDELRWTRPEIPGGRPTGRTFFAAALDPFRREIWVDGGSGPATALCVAEDSWRLELEPAPRWVPYGSSFRWGQFGVFDPARRRFLVLQGRADGFSERQGYFYHLSVARTREIVDEPAVPLSLLPFEPLVNEAAVSFFDPWAGIVRSTRGARTTLRDYYWCPDRCFIIYVEDPQPHGEEYGLGFTVPGGWSRAVVKGVPPRHSMPAWALDTRRRRILTFGGFRWQSASFFDVSNQTHAWELEGEGPHWTTLSVTGDIPPPRGYATACYDSLRDRFLLVGGYNHPDGPTGSPYPGYAVDRGLWILDCSSHKWSRAASEAPSPGGRLHFFSDARRDRAVLFDQDYGRTWFLDLGTLEWSELSSTNPPSFYTYYPLSSAFDPVENRLLLLSEDGRTFAQSLAPPYAWRNLSPEGLAPHVEGMARLVYDSAGDRFWLVGGVAPGGNAVLSFRGRNIGSRAATIASAQVDAAPIAGTAMRLIGGVVREAIVVELARPLTEVAEIRVFDIAGRSWLTDRLPPGTTGRVSIPAADLRPGMYFVRARTGSQTLRSRVIVVAH